jgi:AcrR family transcriptional regulator
VSEQTLSRKDQIYAVAERLFSRNGYHATTMREIARELEIEGGSLYSHITGKQELLYQIVLRASHKFVRAGRAAAGSPDAPADQLRAFMRQHLAIIAASVDGAVVYFHQWRHLEPEQRATITAHRDEYESYLRRILSAGVACGQFAAGDERLLSKFIFSALNWTYQWYRPDGPLSAEQLADAYYEYVMAGLAAKPQEEADR